MSESIWWPDDAWWERKVLPLGFITLSFRQLGTILFAFLAAFVISLPFQFPIAGISFGGRAAVFCGVFGVGYIISNRRVKLLAAELQALHYLRTVEIVKVRRMLGRSLGRRRTVNESSSKDDEPLVPLKIAVDDFRNPLPLVISDRVGGVSKEEKVQLFLDDQLRGEDLLTPQKSRYRLLYSPLPQDVGNHRLCVKVNDSSEPIVAINLQLGGKGSEVDELMVKVK